MEERDRILKMVQEHKLTAEEGARLLDILEAQDAPVAETVDCRVSLEPVFQCLGEWSQTFAQTVARSITEAVERPLRNNIRPALSVLVNGNWFRA